MVSSEQHLPPMKKIYFLSDAHLGSRATQDSRERELFLCSFLDHIRQDASAIYLMGDIFDFWFEYHNVVPKGFTRFLGKLAELTDEGMEIHFFTGNHDMWAFDYLHEECGVVLHTEPCEIQLPTENGSPSPTAFLAHGDGLGDNSSSLRLLHNIFHSRVCRWLFRNILPPDWGMEFGLRWAKSSRLKHDSFLIGENGDTLSVSADGTVSNGMGDILTNNGSIGESFLGEDKEHLVLFSKQYLLEHPHISYFIFGHRHIELDLMLTRSSRILILGEWIRSFTYAVWDGENMVMDNFAD